MSWRALSAQTSTTTRSETVCSELVNVSDGAELGLWIALGMRRVGMWRACKAEGATSAHGPSRRFQRLIISVVIGGIADIGWACRWLDPVASDPSLPSAAKFAVMQNAASTSREGDDVIAPRVEGRVARH